MNKKFYDNKQEKENKTKNIFLFYEPTMMLFIGI